MKKLLILVVFLCGNASSVMAQVQDNTLSLTDIYRAFYQNYPTVNKKAFFTELKEFNQRVNSSLLYPDLQVSGLASYQSQVTEVPFAAPGSPAPTFSKDHYSLAIDVTQSIYNGGRVSILNQIEERKEEVSQAGLELELYQMRLQLNQLFFNTLMLKKQQEIQQLMIEDLNNQLQVVSARVKNGVLLPGNEWTLKAERLKAEQQLIQTRHAMDAGYEFLEELTGLDLSSRPSLSADITALKEDAVTSNQRPEYDLFGANKKVLQEQEKLAGAEKKPVITAFAKTAYSRPGLDAFSDDLELWWMIGLRAQWNLRSVQNSTRKQEVLRIQQKSVSAEEDAFTRQLNGSLSESESRIQTLNEQIELDKEVLQLREQVVAEKKKQLDEGAITSAEWLTELNAQHRARLNLEFHLVELIKARTELETKKGISWN